MAASVPTSAESPRTAALAARAAAAFPDARLTAADTRPFPVVMARGAGDRIFDVDGREYLDFHLSSGALVLGHAHPDVQAALVRQVAAGSNFGAMNAAAIDLAERIVAAVPSIDSVKLVVSGTEATLHAIRMARAYTGRDLIVRFEGAYHGHLDMVSLSSKLATLGPQDRDRPPSRRPIPDCPGIPEAIQQLCLVASFNDGEALRRIFVEEGERIACVIMEPFQRFIEPRPGFLELARKLTRAHGALLVFDEIVTGFRFGPGGAQEHYGVRPDLTALGKIIGAGYPNGAIGGSSEIMNALFGKAARSPVYLAGTFAGHPVASAGGAATLDVLARPGAYERLFALGQRARDGLAAAFARRGVPGRVFGVGPLFHLFFADVDVANARDALAEDKGLRKRVWDALLRRGVHITGARGFVSLQHSESTVDDLVGRFDAALGDL
ncbi:MAG: aminotransferase class III-fold pyridoxal phosphate-dependent enzyme [Burkholderiales bacterium]